MGAIDFIKRAERKYYLYHKRRKLKNHNPTVLSSNCNGAMILHDMRCCFNSPMVNLYVLPEDFLKLLAEPMRYFREELVEIETDRDFPVGRVLDITIYFMHYKSFEEAKGKWCERAKRVNMDNLFVMMTEKDGCTEEQIARFDALPYKNKVIFTHRLYPKYKSAYYIPGFEQIGEMGILSDNKPGFWKRRYIDEFDYVRFLNGEGF